MRERVFAVHVCVCLNPLLYKLNASLRIDSSGRKVMGAGHLYMPLCVCLLQRKTLCVHLCVTAKVLLNRCVLQSALTEINYKLHKSTHSHTHLHKDIHTDTYTLNTVCP